jgi:diadenylate cyclase
MTRVDELLALVSFRDLVDILVVGFLIYQALLLIRGTRAVQILLGILFVGGFYYLARSLELLTLTRILEGFLSFLPFAMIVLFQQEIRRALAAFGRNPLWGLKAQQEVQSGFDEIVLAASALADRKTGALIVIERLEGLRNYVENGIRLDAALTFDLLVNIFTPGTPLHDGAVILQKGRIAAAACFLPLTASPEMSKDLGTRHRAAVGVTEETDALAVVVSEETGRISVAFAGQLTTGLDAKNLRNTLYKRLLTDLYPRGGAAR